MKKNDWTGLWIVEWNETQGAFHIEGADTRFKDSINSYLNGKNRGSRIC